MTITAAQAQAELDRRSKASAPRFTAGQAQAELERRQSTGAENEPGIMQQLFDVKNSNTGESYLYGNTPAPAPYEDLNRTVADTVSRGYLDKLQGPEAQARTEAARERMPGWVELPTDIGAAVASSPYRIGSTAVGAGLGALEGAASAYGHQKDWIPDAEGALDIARGAGIGTVTGGLGARVGGWLGGRQAGKAAEATRPVPDAAAVANADQVLATKGMTRDDFAKALADAPPELQARIAEIAGGKSLTSKVGEMMPKTLTGGGIDRTLLTFLTLGPKAAGVRLGAQGLKAAGESAWANQVPDKEVEALARLASDGALKLDPAIIDKWRDSFAKVGIGYGRSQ